MPDTTTVGAAMWDRERSRARRAGMLAEYDAIRRREQSALQRARDALFTAAARKATDDYLAVRAERLKLNRAIDRVLDRRRAAS